MPLTGGQDHDFVPQFWSQPQFLFDIGFYPAAMGGVKRANIDDPHRPDAIALTARRPARFYN